MGDLTRTWLQAICEGAHSLPRATKRCGVDDVEAGRGEGGRGSGALPAADRRGREAARTARMQTLLRGETAAADEGTSIGFLLLGCEIFPLPILFFPHSGSQASQLQLTRGPLDGTKGGQRPTHARNGAIVDGLGALACS
jgi:hypothetical protein